MREYGTVLASARPSNMGVVDSQLVGVVESDLTKARSPNTVKMRGRSAGNQREFERTISRILPNNKHSRTSTYNRSFSPTPIAWAPSSIEPPTATWRIDHYSPTIQVQIGRLACRSSSLYCTSYDDLPQSPNDGSIAVVLIS